MANRDDEAKDGLLSTSSSRDSFNDLIDDERAGAQGSSASFSMVDPADMNIFQRLYNNVIVPNMGLSLVILAQFFNSCMNMACKLLETDPGFEQKMNPFQILFVRMSATYLLSIIYMYVNKIPDAPLGPKPLRKWLVLRGFTGFFGVFGVYFSLQYLSVSDATVLIFLSPTITGLLAWIALKERYTVVEAVGGFCSLFGVILIARPTFIFGVRSNSANDAVESSDPLKRDLAIAVALLGTVGAGSVVVVIRFIGKRAHALISVSYYSLWCCIVSFFAILIVPSYSFQLPQNGRQWFYFIMIGLSGFIMQFCLTVGIQLEKAGRTSLMVYTQMIWALLWEVAIWHHMPPLLSWMGFIIIIGSAICIVYFKPKEPTAPETTEENIEMSTRA